MTSSSVMLQDRVQAANLLAERLMVYKNTNTLVLAIPPGGVVVGCHLAKLLNLSLAIIPGGKIKHPSMIADTIGSVTMDEVLLKEQYRDLPQDYVYHQIVLLQHSLKAKYEFYEGDKMRESLTGKNVILVDDLSLDGELVLACLKSISKEQPARIIVAVPVISPDAQQQISKEVDDLIFLVTDKENAYENYEEVNDEKVKNLLLSHRKQ